MSNTTSPQPTAVALIQEGKTGLRATGAFDRFDLPFAGKAKPGDLVEVRVEKHRARPVQVIGRPSSVEAVIEALAIHAGEREFSERLEKEAETAGKRPDQGSRRDLRNLVTFTIDGTSTCDFDDAISARREGKRIRVWVHVADVASFVRPGSALDEEALCRATSVYLPTLTVPMLPRSLSNGACSLMPGEDRRTLTCEMLLEDGIVKERKIYRSLIRSDARLTYDHVEEIFLGRAEPGATYAAALAAARRAAIDRALERAEFRSEPYFEFAGGEVIAMHERPEQESARLIERLMVLANQEVAGFLLERNVPTLYRVHAAADPERLELMHRRLRSLGVDLEHGASIADALKIDVDDEFSELAYAALSPAMYTREAASHDGLGISAYTHFTSPIRRYADLVVHRALLSEIGHESLAQAPRHVELPDIAEHLNERTRTVKKLSRRAEDICRVSLLRREIRAGRESRTLSGRISGMSAGSCFVDVGICEGRLSGRALGGAPNEEMTIWPRKTGELRFGQQLEVKIRRIDPVRGQLDLVPA